jgi:hypothetical protein
VTGPKPPQWDENQDEFPELVRVEMTLARVAQDVRYVIDRHHKNQVEEALEPGGMSVGLGIFCIVHSGLTSMEVIGADDVRQIAP